MIFGVALRAYVFWHEEGGTIGSSITKRDKNYIWEWIKEKIKYFNYG